MARAPTSLLLLIDRRNRLQGELGRLEALKRDAPAPFLGTIEGGLYCAGMFAVVAIVALALDLLVRLLRRLRASEAVCRTLELTALSLVVLDCPLSLARRWRIRRTRSEAPVPPAAAQPS